MRALGRGRTMQCLMTLFGSLGFRWDRDSIFTFPEVKTLLEGVTVGGRKLSDQEQILNLAESSKYLIELVKQGQFKLDKDTFCSLNARVARHEALEWGHFRGEGPETTYTLQVALGQRGRFTPLPTERGAARLNEVFANGVRALRENVSNSFERAAAFFLFGSIQQFFFDGNKRSSRFMMNGLLMTEGIDAITEMMGFVLDCHPRNHSDPSAQPRTLRHKGFA